MKSTHTLRYLGGDNVISSVTEHRGSKGLLINFNMEIFDHVIEAGRGKTRERENNENISGFGIGVKIK